MLHNLSLKELEELHALLEQARKILNPDALSILQLYKRDYQQTITLENLTIDVMHRIIKKYQERRK